MKRATSLMLILALAGCTSESAKDLPNDGAVVHGLPTAVTTADDSHCETTWELAGPQLRELSDRIVVGTITSVEPIMDKIWTSLDRRTPLDACSPTDVFFGFDVTLSDVRSIHPADAEGSEVTFQIPGAATEFWASTIGLWEDGEYHGNYYDDYVPPPGPHPDGTMQWTDPSYRLEPGQRVLAVLVKDSDDRLSTAGYPLGYFAGSAMSWQHERNLLSTCRTVSPTLEGKGESELDALFASAAEPDSVPFKHPLSPHQTDSLCGIGLEPENSRTPPADAGM